MKIKAMLLILAIFSSPALGFVDLASADPTPACDSLAVRLYGASDGWFVRTEKCYHGKSSREDDVNIILIPVDGGWYGPDCEVVIERKDAEAPDDNRYIYRVGQGICSIKYKAGKIHVEQKGESSLQYQVQKGSYKDEEGGVVIFTMP